MHPILYRIGVTLVGAVVAAFLLVVAFAVLAVSTPRPTPAAISYCPAGNVFLPCRHIDRARRWSAVA